MTTTTLILWLMVMLLGFAGSAMYSGMETGTYTLNRIRLQILDHQHDRRARRLRRLIENPTLLLTILLVGNNLANYLGTASLQVMLNEAGLNEWQAMALNVALVTPILFIFGETLPKDLFAAHADRWMIRLTPVLAFSRWVYTLVPVIPVVNLFSIAAMKLLGQKARVPAFHPRRQVETLVREGVGYGLISDEQSAIAERVFDLSERVVADEMVPWHRVICVKQHDTVATVRAIADRTSRTRLPVVDEHGQVTGVLNVLDVLMEPQPGVSLDRFIAETHVLAADVPIQQALRLMQQWRARMAIVAESPRHPLGIVTLKDLVEPITGELLSW